MAYKKTLYRKINSDIHKTAQRTMQWHTKHCVENLAMTYKTLYRKLINGIQNTVQKTKQWHTKHCIKK